MKPPSRLIRPLSGLCSLAVFTAACSLSAQSLPFADDFNRPDSITIGNGWSTFSTGSDQLEISNHAAAFLHPDAFVTLYRPADFTAPLTLTATFREVSGFGGVGLRYGVAMGILDTGPGDGYRLSFNRGDANFSDSSIALYDGATFVASFTPTFQFGSAITASATFFLDGSVLGTISSDGNSYNFSSGAYAVQSAGANVVFGSGGPDSRAGTYIFGTIDDVSIAAIPEPANTVLFFGTAALALLRERRRRLSRPVECVR
jgi:hypothetical protein